MDIYLPDEEPIYEPMELSRAIFFKVNGQDDSQTDSYFTYEMTDNGVADDQLTVVQFTMPDECAEETFEVIVCYNYTSTAEALPNIQNLCDTNTLHTFNCIPLPETLSPPIAVETVESSYTVIFGQT